MLKTQELKLFCKEFGVTFPNIQIVQRGLIYFYKVEWYNTVITESSLPIHLNSSKDSMLVFIITELSKWLDTESNFLCLMNLSNTTMC